MIKTFRILILILIPTTFLFIGCAAVSVNHFQDGKSLGKNNSSTHFGMNTGLSFLTTETELDDGSYSVETDILTNTPFMNIFYSHGITSRLDGGADFFTTLGSSGLQGFVKYALLDSSSKMGIAVMPMIGFSEPWRRSEEGEETSEVDIVGRIIFFELAVPMSYHPSPDVAITFGPQFYFHHNYARHRTGAHVTIKREGKGSYMSPGVSIGLHYKKIRIGGTFIKVQDEGWLPFAGFALSTDLFSK